MKTKPPRARLPLAARFLLALLLLPVPLFCGFGFLATFESNDPWVTWTFRLLYPVVGFASGLGAVRLLFTLHRDA